MGRYVPPDAEGVVSGNQLHRKHALGARAAKQAQGILTVRFEMPFAVWCTTCAPPALIGQGVRFNAEKRKVGAYHSTPVLAFTMRHPPCGGRIELRTDPATGDYVVAEGGRRRDTAAGDERAAAESLVAVGARRDVEMRLARDRDEARRSAFANLERTIEHRGAAAAARERVTELEDASARAWDDPYARNRALRRAFRAGRREREADTAAAEDVKDRMGLDLELLPRSEEDARRAALVDFGGPDAADGPVDRALAQPLFAMAPSREEKEGKQLLRGKTESSKEKKPKPEAVAARTKASLVSVIKGKARMARDPFLDGHGKEAPKGPSLIPGLRRKRPQEEGVAPQAEEPPVPKPPTPAAGCLVAYDSD